MVDVENMNDQQQNHGGYESPPNGLQPRIDAAPTVENRAGKIE
jgi:hypothetical protein